MSARCPHVPIYSFTLPADFQSTESGMLDFRRNIDAVTAKLHGTGSGLIRLETFGNARTEMLLARVSDCACKIDGTQLPLILTHAAATQLVSYAPTGEVMDPSGGDVGSSIGVKDGKQIGSLCT